MYSVPDVCDVNAGVLVDAFDHCLGEVEPAAGNGYIAEHRLKGCSGCLFEVCHGAENYTPPSLTETTCLLLTYELTLCVNAVIILLLQSKSLKQYPYNFECGVRYVFGFVREIITCRAH